MNRQNITIYLKLYVMRFIDKKQKLDYLIELIEKENTGTSDELCKHIFVSKRTFVRLLKDLRILGHQISFCSQRKTYYMIKKDD